MCLVDKLAERVGELDGDLTAAVAANCQIPVEPYIPKPQPEPPACGVPIIAGELHIPVDAFDGLLMVSPE